MFDWRPIRLDTTAVVTTVSAGRNTDPGELELRAVGHLADIAKIATE
jgi:hypothetical protein